MILAATRPRGIARQETTTVTTMTRKLYYRIQPRGLPLLGHTSEDWVGTIMASNRVCAYDSHQALLAGAGDDWVRYRGAEVVTFWGRDPQPLGPRVPGISVIPTRELDREPLGSFLRGTV